MTNSKKLKLIYFHGLNSDSSSRKFLELKEYFREYFDSICIEWTNVDNIKEIIEQSCLSLNKERSMVIIGDSTGANFAYQLREFRKTQGVKSILILLSPLLVFEKKTSTISFPENVKNYLWNIKNPEDAMIVFSITDDIIDFHFLNEQIMNNVKLLNVDDTHRLQNFSEYIPMINDYIKIKCK